MGYFFLFVGIAIFLYWSLNTSNRSHTNNQRIKPNNVGKSNPKILYEIMFETMCKNAYETFQENQHLHEMTAGMYIKSRIASDYKTFKESVPELATKFNMSQNDVLVVLESCKNDVLKTVFTNT